MENEYEKQDSKNVLYLNLESFLRAKHIKLESEQVARKDIDYWIINPIETFFDINMDIALKKQIANLVTTSLNGRKVWSKYYDYLLNRIKPKLILLVVSYSVDRMILCEVAKKRKIPTIELQHGRIDAMHLAYNFYKKINLSSFPDYIFTFGQLEKKYTKFPINKENIIPVGYPELEKNYNIYHKKKRKRGKKIILFVSPGGDESIAQYAYNVAQQLNEKKYHVIFKLHPQEYFDWRAKIGKYLIHPNIEVVGNYEQTIYYFIAQSDWVIGNFSTTLYEAQIFGVKIAIIKIGSYQCSKSLYDNGCALLVDSPENLVKKIEEDSFRPNEEVIFFEKNSIQNMQKNIDLIIANYYK